MAYSMASSVGLDDRVDFAQRPIVVRMASHAGETDVHGVGTNVLAELQELVVAKTVGRAVLPVAPHARSVFRRTNHFPPFRGLIPRKSFHVTATGIADERRFQILQVLGQVRAQPVGAAFIGRRKERDPVDLQRTSPLEGEHEAALGVRARRLEFRCELLPGRGALDFAEIMAGEDSSVLAFQRSRQLVPGSRRETGETSRHRTCRLAPRCPNSRC